MAYAFNLLSEQDLPALQPAVPEKAVLATHIR